MPYRFEWIDRTACVEAIAEACVDREAKFDVIIPEFLREPYCRNITQITIKRKAQLKRDVTKRIKDIQNERKAPEVGDTVMVPKLQAGHPLLGGSIQQGRKLVQAVVENVKQTSFSLTYQVRFPDGSTQTGNGHMIKRVIKKAE